MVVNDSLHCEPSTKRRRCLIGEERKLAHNNIDDDNNGAAVEEEEVIPSATSATATTTTTTTTTSGRKITTIFIGGLHPRILQAHLEKMCQPYGTIERLHLCDKKGYAFCQYSNSDQAEAAMTALDGRGLLGRRLMVRPAHDQQQQHHQNIHHNQHSSSNSNSNSTSRQSDPRKERERIDAKIQAVKRKLQTAQQQSSGGGGM